MIDLHSHILPGIDDGSPTLATSIEMARMAVDDGITHMVCTPHIMPGVFENTTSTIEQATEHLRYELLNRDIPLELYVGADVHIAPNLPERLAFGDVPTLNGTRYFLFEPPHHVLPPRIGDLVARLMRQGFVPVLTHPERMTWIETHYEMVVQLNDLGCLLQLTAESITGAFGRAARINSEKLLAEGRVAVVATDAHGTKARRPCLSRARAGLATLVGEEEADNMVIFRPAAILADEPMPQICRPEKAQKSGPERQGVLDRLFSGGAS
ncbi:protein-tyrosine phosphatase [Rhodoligotrophos appendicifer]|uniref:tyrosine-protein phosphatase n=1 Tax=Rhodoligotrophos appendicifer TaxID=987056 RepID=UPI0019602336|nr:CpsB/CapC family capsule biosynthesis tyrosine phosphatase [Rhodoligotrophos appendicifer]